MATDGKRDRELLRSPCDVEEEDDLRLDRVKAEIDMGFDALRDVEDGVSIFGSARVKEGTAGTGSAVRPRIAWRARASP